ncbi:hypothetical protein TRVL_10005 [Trypanosoma vivax]|nr:hypothetical protein TRVL_10005 [Trypanosoma vivax]
MWHWYCFVSFCFSLCKHADCVYHVGHIPVQYFVPAAVRPPTSPACFRVFNISCFLHITSFHAVARIFGSQSKGTANKEEGTPVRGLQPNAWKTWEAAREEKEVEAPKAIRNGARSLGQHSQPQAKGARDSQGAPPAGDKAAHQ